MKGKGGIGFILLLIVALIVAYLVVGNVKSTSSTTAPSGAESVQSENPVEQAQSVVDALNEKTRQSGGE